MELVGLAFIPMDLQSYAELADVADTYRMVKSLYPKKQSVAGLDMYTHATPVWKPERSPGRLGYGITHARNPDQPSLHYRQIEDHADVYLRDEGAGPNPPPLNEEDLNAWERETPLRFEVGPTTHSQLELEPKALRASVKVSEGSRGRLEFVWSLPSDSSIKTNAVYYNDVMEMFGPPPPSFRAFERM